MLQHESSRQSRTLTWVLGLFLIVLLASACSKGTYGTAEAPIQESGAPIAVSVVSHQLERIEVDGDDGPIVFPDPVYAVRLKFENTSEADVLYQPSHGAETAVAAQAPLLFVDAGEGNPLTENINGVLLKGGFAPGQQSKGLTITAGESIEDVYTFSAPPNEQMNLVLHVPPTLHKGKKPILIKLPYQANELEGPAAAKAGEEVTLGDVSVKVKSAKVRYLDMEDTSTKAAGHSGNPVYAVEVEVKNGGGTPVTYAPNHRASGRNVVGPSLSAGDSDFLRVKFGANNSVKGQVAGTETIEKGKSVSDIIVFQRPGKSVKNVVLTIPGTIFGQPGVARFALDYKHADPEKPKAP